MEDVKFYIQSLVKNSSLRSSENVEKFEISLSKLSGVDLSADDIHTLYSVFDDNTDDHEVMFGLVHLLDEYFIKNYKTGVASLLRAENAIKDPEGDWFEILISRALNNKFSREELHNQLNRKDHPRTFAMLQKLAEDDNEILAGNARWVLSD